MTGARRAVSTTSAPPPAGTYSQGVVAGGVLYASGQTPRLPDGTRRGDEPFDVQARLVLGNLGAVVEAAGARLADAAMVTVYLRDPAGQAAAFDEIYRETLGETSCPPARAVVQSSLPHGELEVTAVVPLGEE